MKCPFCHADNDRVIDSRTSNEGFVIRRRRECLSCKERYTTYERLEEIAKKVVKKGGAREPFRREKIRQGVERACWKRAVSDQVIESLVTDVENYIHAHFDVEVESRVLGELVMDRLRQVDQVAFVRFASVYRDFEDARDFVDELTPMLNGQLTKKPH